MNTLRDWLTPPALKNKEKEDAEQEILREKEEKAALLAEIEEIKKAKLKAVESMERQLEALGDAAIKSGRSVGKLADVLGKLAKLRGLDKGK